MNIILRYSYSLGIHDWSVSAGPVYINKGDQVLNFNYTFCFLNEAILQTGPFFIFS